MGIIIIIDLFGISKSAAHSTIKNYQNRGSFTSAVRSGRPKILSDRDISLLVREVIKIPSITSGELSKDLLSYSGKSVSRSTIKENLRHQGLKCYKATKKPLIPCCAKKRRILWCEKYKNKDASFWRKILYSDETMVSINYSWVMNQIRRFPWNNPYSPQFTRNAVKHPLKLMFWGSFGYNGVGSIIPFEGKMNSNDYKEILESNLKKDLTNTGCLIFQEDSSRVHTAMKVRNWLDSKNIVKLEWPTHSPDLNPIENLWAILKYKLRRRTVKTKKELIYWVKREWKEIPKQKIENLIDSIPRRISKVLRNKGGPTKY